MRIARPLPTIRARLTAAAAAVTMLMLAVASVTIIGIQGRVLTAGVDEALSQRADNLEPIDPAATSLPSEGDPEDTFAQLLDSSGRLVAGSANVAQDPVVPLRDRDPARSHLMSVRLDHPSGHYRVLMRPVHGRTDRIVVVGKNLDDVNDSVRILTLTLGGVSPVLALLLGLVAWWLTGRTLRPVEAIRKEVQGIHGGELHRRVPIPATDDEIAELARTMNGMLERVEAASQRQQQFVDDASHELRTPLTRMVADLEVAVAHPDREPAAATMDRLLEDAEDLRQLLADLLFLARTSHDPVAAQDEVDLDDIALHVARAVQPPANLRIDTAGVSAARVMGDGRALERAVRNLVENALRHAAGAVAISTVTGHGLSTIVVDDDGPGVPPADRTRIFERFTRLDEARTRAAGGAGLGLAIVADIARRHQGSIEISDSPLGGARFTLALPAAD